MGSRSKKTGGKELAAGLITLVLAVVLTVSTMAALTNCTAPFTQPPSVSTPPGATLPPAPTLAANPYSPEDFTLVDGYLTCLAAESWLGIDVSEHQGVIDWKTVATTPVEFAMVRLGFRGWGSEGNIHADKYGMANLIGARDAGLQVGVYFFSQAISVEEAIEEAHFLLSLLDGRPLDLPVVFDWETVSSQEARTAKMNKKTLNACAQAFCQEIEKAGYDAMVYFNLDLSRRMLRLIDLQQAGYDFWLALYSQQLRCDYRVRMWQYTDSGTVAGIQGKVDLNLYFPNP